MFTAWTLTDHGVGPVLARILKLPKVSCLAAHSNLRRIALGRTVRSLLRTSMADSMVERQMRAMHEQDDVSPPPSYLSLTSPPMTSTPQRTQRVPLWFSSPDPVRRAMARVVAHHFLATFRLSQQASPATYAEASGPLNVCIDSIDALYSPVSEVAYQAQSQKLRAAHDQRGAKWPGLEERYAYHGTKPYLVSTLLEAGMRAEFNQRGNYGYGNYLAVHSSYSHAYADAAPDGRRYMFVGRAIVNGARITTSGDMQPGTAARSGVPPWITTVVGNLPSYPTVVGTDSVQDPHIYVVAENDSILPQFLITYHLTS